MRFSRPEHWSEFLVHSPGDLPNPGIQPTSPALQAVSLPLSHQEKLARRPVVASASELQAGTTLISDFWPPELNNFLSFQVTKFMYLVGQKVLSGLPVPSYETI